MTRYQKDLLEQYFEQSIPFHVAAQVICPENCEQEIDARFTWQRWLREENDWGFHTF